MIITALLALIISNSGGAQWYNSFIYMPVSFGLGEQIITWPLKQLVKDILMVFFFLLVGMELKREMLDGFLSDKKQIILPLLAAIGGMAAPAAIFLLINHGQPQNWDGWAIPCATDIAFAISILVMAGKHIPSALRIFLLAIAIFDDLGAILIIAFFYSGELSITYLLLSVAATGVLFAFNRLGVMAISAYIIAGIVLCFFLHHGGIHTTIGGVFVGMAIPLRNPHNQFNSPLNNCMNFLHPWVNFFILPIFAFTAAGVNLHALNMDSILEPLTLGVALGLFAGKQIGILATTWLVVKSGLAALPEGVNWRHIHGISIVAGIGFTMSLFIGILAFDNVQVQNQVKLGVIMGTMFSMICGWLVLRFSNRKQGDY